MGKYALLTNGLIFDKEKKNIKQINIVKEADNLFDLLERKTAKIVYTKIEEGYIDSIVTCAGIPEDFEKNEKNYFINSIYDKDNNLIYYNYRTYTEEENLERLNNLTYFLKKNEIKNIKFNSLMDGIIIYRKDDIEVWSDTNSNVDLYVIKGLELKDFIYVKENVDNVAH